MKLVFVPNVQMVHSLIGTCKISINNQVMDSPIISTTMTDFVLIVHYQNVQHVDLQILVKPVLMVMFGHNLPLTKLDHVN